jgi:hypothetical protein
LVLLVHLELQEYQVQTDAMASMGLLEFLAQMELTVWMVRQEIQVLKVCKELQDLLVLPVYQGHKELKVLQDLQVLLELVAEAEEDSLASAVEKFHLERVMTASM